MKNHFSRLVSVLIVISLCCCFTLQTRAEETTSPVSEEGTKYHGHFVAVSDTRRTGYNIDYSNHTTEELIDVILNDQELLLCALHLDSTGDPYRTAIRLSKALVELETRVDADNELYDKYLSALDQGSTSDDELTFLTLLLSQPIFSDNLSTSINASNTRSTYVTGNFISYEGFSYSYTADGKTYGGLEVALYTASSDYNINEKQAVRMRIASSNPNAVYKGAATSAYNSHSYAWYEHSTTLTYAIFDLTNYINDPHTTIITGDITELQEGDIMVYYNEDGSIIHSAVVLRVEDGIPVCISKWGTSGLYEHDFNDVPANYKIDTDFGIVDTDAYRIESHSYKVTAKSAYNHTKTCSVCGDSYNEVHNVVNDRCLICGFTGPFMQMGTVPPIEETAVTAAFSRKQS